MPRPTLGFCLWLALLAGAAASGAGLSGDDATFLVQQRVVVSLNNTAAMQEDLDLARRISIAVTKLPVDSTVRRLLSRFLVCGACSSFRRLGEANNGGYLTCMDNMKGIKGILTMGVERRDRWAQAAQKEFPAPVGQFDCNVGRGFQCDDGCTFYRDCLCSKDSHENFLGSSVTLREALDRVVGPRSKQKVALGKIDIEGSEWPIFEVEPKGQLRRFRQLIVEFHDLDDESRHEQYIVAVQSLLDAGFKVVHVHGNIFGGMYRPLADPNLAIPKVLEVTFVTDAPRAPNCEAAPS